MTHIQDLQRAETPDVMPGRLYTPIARLTRRDRDVMALVLAGHRNAEIARRLNIQLQTLKNALSAIYDKLGVSTRLQLAVLLLRDAAPDTRGGRALPGAPCTLPAPAALSRI